jgi:hypothetical protein
MASDDRPPKKLEAVTRRFSSYLQQELQLENLDDLKRLPEEFLDRARRSLELMFPPVAKQLEDEAAVARVAHEVASSLFSAPLLKSIEAKRISEIEGLGKRHKKDPELVATWIREGLSTDAVGALILAGYTNKLKPVSFPSSEQRDESDRAFLRQIGFRSAKPITTGAAADRKDEVDLSEKEQPEEKLDRKISAEAKATETETPAPQSERKNGDPRPQELAAQAAARTAEFEQWLAPELQRIADDAMIEAAKQEAEAAAQEAGRQKAAGEAINTSRGSADAGDLIAAAVTPEMGTSAAVTSIPKEQIDQEKLAERQTLWAKAERGESLTYAQVRTLFELPERTLHNWLRDGKLKKTTKRGRISAESIRANTPDFNVGPSRRAG